MFRSRDETLMGGSTVTRIVSSAGALRRSGSMVVDSTGALIIRCVEGETKRSSALQEMAVEFSGAPVIRSVAGGPSA